jgi:hypothetical protein
MDLAGLFGVGAAAALFVALWIPWRLTAGRPECRAC